ncbi:gene transfer agent family protein [Thalassorhabdomicrobium marinisediminis]|uniref:Gene transfer agent family protein n=1 Tax=Thalassorhabdomicrobium marinisediminis TaxID=2170577 RepID=A0A2T7FVG3_9RHOB|nr:gene transfer agent family protein [Thalassorhabdomicrobium marinisediminis]PVA06119.1 gene transfer agent family protein [Thalassorhabdomicrobium marinisediminis]
MSDITHTGFFGDTEHTFALTDAMILELERLAGVGIGALYNRAISMQFSNADIVQTIRLGLIGGGMVPEQAKTLTDTYAVDRPMAETFPLALDILDARWSGNPTLEPETKETTE